MSERSSAAIEQIKHLYKAKITWFIVALINALNVSPLSSLGFPAAHYGCKLA